LNITDQTGRTKSQIQEFPCWG